MKKDNLGNPISTATDEIDGQRWIVIRDSAGKNNESPKRVMEQSE